MPVDDLVAEAARARRCGVVVDPISYLALCENEREALALADAAIQLGADEETWADRARGEFLEGVRNA